MEKNQIKGIVSLIVAALLFSLYGIFSRLLGLDFGIFYQAFSRSLIIFLILIVFLLLKRTWKKVEKKDWKWFLAMSSFGLTSVIGFFVTANKLTIATNLFLFYTGSTIGGYILGSILFKEKLTRIKIVSLLVCLAGLLMIFSSPLEKQDLVYMVLAFSIGFGAAAWAVFSKKVSSKYSLVQISAIDEFIFVVLTLPLIIIFKEPILLPVFSLLWLNVFLFAFSVLAASLLVFNGFKRLEAQTGTLFMLLEPVFGVVLGWLFYKEFLTIYSLLGGALILLGAALPNINLKKKSR